MKRPLLLTLLLSLFFIAKAQDLIVPLNDDYEMDLQKAAYNSEYRFHTSMHPWREAQFDGIANLDSIQKAQYWKKQFGRKWKDILWNSLFNTDVVAIEGNDSSTLWGNVPIGKASEKGPKNFYIAGNPLVDFQLGKENGLGHSLWRNTRGAEIKGSIGENFAFHSSMRENQAVFPAYVEENIRENQAVIPGQGWTKNYGEHGFDFTYCSAYLSFSPTNWFNATLGYGKNFIGDGYRSLILSDNAFNYPYLKLSADFWHIQYNCLYMQLIDRSTTISSTIGYARKYINMHYLDWAITKRFNFSFFDAIVWSAEDTTGYRGIDIQYLNPIVFMRPVEYTVGPSPDNALMGVNMSYIFGKHTTLYGQFVLDEMIVSHFFWSDGWYANKQAYQIGLKTYDAFKIKNLFLQSEFNHVRPYMYTHYGQSQNYAHFNQALAHPWGANFWEVVCRAQYNYKRFYLQYKLNYGLYGDDPDDVSAGHYGHNIFLNYRDYVHQEGPDGTLGHYVGQGIETHVLMNDVVLSWLVNPTYNLNVFVELMQRRISTPDFTTNNTIMSFGLRTSLERLYYDF
jgi:hypothetical protein